VYSILNIARTTLASAILVSVSAVLVHAQQPTPGQVPGQPKQPVPGQVPGQPKQPIPGQVPGQPKQPTPGQVPGQPTQPGVQPGTTQPGTTQPTVNQPMVTGINRTPWFNNTQIRRDLNLGDAQFRNLNTVYQQAYTNYQNGLNRISPNQTAAQRQQAIQNLQQQFYKSFNNNSAQYLTDPTQKQRMNQLYWQYRGFNAFSDPFVANQLNLTPAQQSRLGAYQQGWTTQMNKISPLLSTNRDQALKQYNDLSTQNTNQINSVLTPQQQAAWREMIGNPYNFNPDVYLPSNTGAPPASAPK
jgi:hypothetical protein